MAETIPNNVSETFQANEKTKEFSLLPNFDSFAKAKGLNEESIKGAKLAISKQFADFNKEGMDNKRFNAISKTIGDMVENEMYKAKSDLAASAKKALTGTTYSSTENLKQEPPIQPQAQTVSVKADNYADGIRAFKERKTGMGALNQ